MRYSPFKLHPNKTEFIILVKTDNVGTSDTKNFTIPTTGSGYNYKVVTSEQTLTNQIGDVTLSWINPGTYEVKISGDFPRIFFNNGGDRLKLLEVKNWGNIVWKDFSSAFRGCSNMDITAEDTPNLSIVTSLNNCFRGCSSLINGNGSISGWNVGNVTGMNFMFSGCTNFNGDISNWNVSNVINMGNMFERATAFNQDIGNWNVSKVIDMSFMFYDANSFNQNIGSWNVGNVTSMPSMFERATSFNQDIGNWNVSKVTNMRLMFYNTNSFNQNLSSWKLRTSGVDCQGMFQTSTVGSGMSGEKYTDTLVGFAINSQANSGPQNVIFTGQNNRTFINSRSGGVIFTDAADARNYLTGTLKWNISDDSII
jgi:surface protein